MGKRKSKARVVKKAIQSVPTQFDCLFCNHSKTVECKLNPSTNLGTIKCRVCNVSFQMEINHLDDPIDVYSAWIDETEKVNRLADEEDGDRAYNDDDDLERRMERREEQRRASRVKEEDEEDLEDY